jgi:hypothetical protein
MLYRARLPAPGKDDLNGLDIVVNATQLGMKLIDPLPIDPRTLAAGTLLVDIVMQPAGPNCCATRPAAACRFILTVRCWRTGCRPISDSSATLMRPRLPHCCCGLRADQDIRAAQDAARAELSC